MSVKTYLSDKVIKKMIGIAPCLRDKLIISFFSDTGCGGTELISIRIGDILLDERTALIRYL
jgi:integrase